MSRFHSDLAAGSGVNAVVDRDLEYLGHIEIARQIDTRLTNIYADLVSLEKMMHYKHSIIDMLKSVVPYINDDSGRRLTLIEQCRKRWLRQAASSAHSDTYNGKYDEDESDQE